MEQKRAWATVCERAPDAICERNDLEDALRKALDKLKPQARRLIELINGFDDEYGKLNIIQASQIMGINPATARNWKKIAMKSLQSILCVA